MSIELYTTIVVWFYAALFLLCTVIGGVRIWKRIRKRTVKYGWIIPCAMFYLISAAIGTLTALIAYDDPADPNYGIFGGWELHDFVLNDIKRLFIWLFIGALLYFLFERKKCGKLFKTGFIVLIISLAVLFVIFTITM